MDDNLVYSIIQITVFKKYTLTWRGFIECAGEETARITALSDVWNAQVTVTTTWCKMLGLERARMESAGEAAAYLYMESMIKESA